MRGGIVSEIRLDSMGRSLVNLLQKSFPLVASPYEALAAELGTDEREVIDRVADLRAKEFVRIIGPVFNSRTLGYRSTLVAMRVPDDRVETAAEIINRHPGVGHDYQRDHYYNLWFTLAVRGEEDLRATLRSMEKDIDPEAMVELPAVRLFKIRLFFDLEGNGAGRDPVETEAPEVIAPLTETDRAVINQLQQQLPVAQRPFDSMARKAGLETDDFLDCCRSLLDRGIMRRYGASIEHYSAGFKANAMVCWAVPQARVEVVGQTMAAYREVTHCYERMTNALWPRYNVFTMIHCRTPRDNADTVARMRRETSVREYEVLSTVREFKKERVRYRV